MLCGGKREKRARRGRGQGATRRSENVIPEFGRLERATGVQCDAGDDSGRTLINGRGGVDATQRME